MSPASPATLNIVILGAGREQMRLSLELLAYNARPLDFFELIAAIGEEKLWFLISTVRRDR